MMQTPKRSHSAEGPQRNSPATPRTARQIKPSGLDSDSLSSSPASKMPKDRSPKVVERKKPASPISEIKPSGLDSDSLSSSPASKMPKDRSPKVVERKKPASPISEKKHPIKVSELESQLAQLQDDLKKAKDQLNSSELLKKRALHEADDVKKQLSAMSAKFEESQKQLLEISDSEDSRIHELRKISKDRDREWESELEAVQKQHSMDSAALISAMNEIQRLKAQHSIEIEGLREELSRTFSLFENLKSEFDDCKESEAQALEAVSKITMQLENANETAEMLRTDGVKGTEAHNLLALELLQSKARVKSLEGLVSKLCEDLVNGSCKKLADDTGNGEREKLKAELNLAKLEVCQFKSALDEAEMRYQEEYIKSTMQIRSVYEQVERTKSESCKKDAESEAELKKVKDLIKELKATLIDKKTDSQLFSEKIKKNSQPREIDSELTEIKASLLEKERELFEKNEELKMEIEKKEAEKTKLEHVTEEAEKNASQVACVTEQLDALQTENTELETELRRLTVQSNQWRKAAEAATAILSTDNNNSGKYGYNTLSAQMGSPFSDGVDGDSPQKRNGNVLKKIGVLWKKGQK